MQQAEQTRGVPLAGLAVKVTNGFYMIGLSNMDADQERNLQLLKERDWVDVLVVYNNNRRAVPRHGKRHTRRTCVRQWVRGLAAIGSALRRQALHREAVD